MGTGHPYLISYTQNVKKSIYDLLEKSRDNSTANLAHAGHEWSRVVCSTTSFLGQKEMISSKSWK